MARKKMVRKVFINKKTKQGMVTLPKKQMKLADPSLKFGDDLFVELEVFKKKTGKKK